jgi:Xaa-Pro aminopeptidase
MMLGRRSAGMIWAVALILSGIDATVAQQTSPLGWRIPELPPPEPIRAEEFAARRNALAASLNDGVLIVFGARAPAHDYLPYQQNPELRYLTGIEEPDAALIMYRAGGQLVERLFVQPRSPSREVWEGVRLGPEGARDQTRIPAEPNDRALQVLDSLLQQKAIVYATTGMPDNDLAAELSYDEQVLMRMAARHPGLQVRSIAGSLNTLRAKKSKPELDRIRRATYLSAEAHRQAMQLTEPRMNEFEVRALVEYFFLRNGGDGPAYASIVGSGPNSTTLHYNADNRCMNAGEVLLFDVAAYFAGYASDVTRTIPVNGKFTPQQRSIYDVVLAAQKAAEKQIKLGARWTDLNQAARTELANGLARIGLIDSPDATYDCGNGRTCPQLGIFYMHGLGHGVGLEVHDPDISTQAGFQPGSAVTIEPGIYVRADAFDYLPNTPDNQAMIRRLRPVLVRYANIGVRIEDVYIFDENGVVERASAGAPREPDEVEALMKQPAAAAAGRRADVVGWRCTPEKT